MNEAREVGWGLSADGCPVCGQEVASYVVYSDDGDLLRVHEACGAAFLLVTEIDFG